jgi:hypothetical protein
MIFWALNWLNSTASSCHILSRGVAEVAGAAAHERPVLLCQVSVVVLWLGRLKVFDGSGDIEEIAGIPD